MTAHPNHSSESGPATSAAETRKSLVVCLEEDGYSPVSYIRIVRHLQDLKQHYLISILVLPRQLPEALDLIPNASLVIMARNRHQASHQAARKAAECHVPILCDVDDYVWEFPDYSKVERHATIYTDDVLSHASCITTPSERLGETIRMKHPTKDVRIVPNAGNIWSGRGKAFTPCVMANSDFFRMPEMKADFFRAIHDAAEEVGKALLLYYFSNDPPEHFTDDPHLRVVWMGFRSYSSYRQLLDHFKPEIGFVLLREEEFSRHKSVIKFAEYSFTGTIGIYSRVEPYVGFIENGISGFLADNTYESWKETVSHALRLDAKTKRQIRARIAHDVKDKFDYERIHADFRSLLADYAKAGPAAASVKENIPELQEFAFREAYAYAAWIIGAEMPRLQQELDHARQTPYHSIGRWTTRLLARIAQWTQRHRETS
jgi:hypothetical protein